MPFAQRAKTVSYVRMYLFHLNNAALFSAFDNLYREQTFFKLIWTMLNLPNIPTIFLQFYFLHLLWKEKTDAKIFV